MPINALKELKPVVHTVIDGGGIYRMIDNETNPAYQVLINNVSITADDVETGSRLTVKKLSPNELGVTTDHYVASIRDGVPEWEKYLSTDT